MSLSARKAARILEYTRSVHGLHRYEAFDRYPVLSLRVAIAQGIAAWFRWVGQA